MKEVNKENAQKLEDILNAAFENSPFTMNVDLYIQRKDGKLYFKVENCDTDSTIVEEVCDDFVEVYELLNKNFFATTFTEVFEFINEVKAEEINEIEVEEKQEFKIKKGINVSDALILISNKKRESNLKGYAFFAKKVVEAVNKETYWCKVDDDGNDDFIRSLEKNIVVVADKYLDDLDFDDFASFCKNNIKKTISEYIDYNCIAHDNCCDPECDSGDFLMQLQCELLGDYNG